MPRESRIKVSKKRKQIMETATSLFIRYGIKRISVEEICREAGASKMTFYKYFPNKIELFKVIWNDWLNEGYCKLDEINSLNIPFPEKMQRLIEYKMKIISQWSDDFFEEIMTIKPEMEELVEQMRNKNISRFMKFVENAQEKRNMRKIRPEMLLAIFDKMKEIIQDESLRKLYPSDTEFLREIHEILFFGILKVDKEGHY